MTRSTTAAAVSRRRVLLGLGAAAAVPVALVTPGAAHAAGPRPVTQQDIRRARRKARATEPECLADLVTQGVVTRADFMVG